MRCGREGSRLSSALLSQLMKSALSQEVDAGELAERLATSLGARRWQDRVFAALQPGACQTGAGPYNLV